MIFKAPPLDAREEGVLEELRGIRRELRHQIAAPTRWIGSLRRVTAARVVQGSNTIEGFEADLDDIVAIEFDEEPLDADEETRRAIRGYRDAMTYVVQLASEPDLVIEENLLKSLHFMMLSYDLTKWPGRWRPGTVFVERERDRAIVYEGPAAGMVPQLMEELVTACRSDEDDAVVRAAMAHLNLAMIHPFKDGNGRMARCLQTLVLSRDGVLEPPFASIEEYLGRNTDDYYDVLAAVGQGSWSPAGDARPWIRFCLTAHLRQARTLRRRIDEAAGIWSELEGLVEARSLPDRVVPALYMATRGMRLRNAIYRRVLDDEVSETVASRDLKALVDAKVLVARGEKRGRFYLAGPDLQQIYSNQRGRRQAESTVDPFG